VTASAQSVVLVVTGLALEARIAAGPGVRTITVGVDPARLAQRLERELARDAFAVMSFGIAGGLAPGIAAGTCVIARGVVGDDGYRRCDERWTQAMAARFPRAVVGDVAGSDAVIADSAAKRALHRATQAIAVDTESHVASRVALAYGLPFAAFRVVADPVERSLPPAVGGALASDGNVKFGAIVRSLARAPAQWPQAARTALDAGAAFAALLSGRRRLGARLGCDPRALLFDVT
jgi:hopanoid-associated phosphorylase